MLLATAIANASIELEKTGVFSADEKGIIAIYTTANRCCQVPHQQCRF